MNRLHIINTVQKALEKLSQKCLKILLKKENIIIIIIIIIILIIKILSQCTNRIEDIVRIIKASSIYLHSSPVGTDSDDEFLPHLHLP